MSRTRAKKLMSKFQLENKIKPIVLYKIFFYLRLYVQTFLNFKQITRVLYSFTPYWFGLLCNFWNLQQFSFLHFLFNINIKCNNYLQIPKPIIYKNLSNIILKKIFQILYIYFTKTFEQIKLHYILQKSYHFKLFW